MPIDRLELCLGWSVPPLHWAGSGGRPPAPWACGQHKMEQGGVGGGRMAGSPLDGKLRPARSLHLCASGDQGSPPRPWGLCGVSGAALARPGLGEPCAPATGLPLPVALLRGSLCCTAWGKLSLPSFVPKTRHSPKFRAASFPCFSVFLLLLPQNEQLITLGAGSV